MEDVFLAPKKIRQAGCAVRKRNADHGLHAVVVRRRLETRRGDERFDVQEGVPEEGLDFNFVLGCERGNFLISLFGVPRQTNSQPTVPIHCATTLPESTTSNHVSL